MEAKLIKNKYGDDFYYLMVDINTYATTHKESFRILSLKNCQAIERGYDLDELAKEFVDYEDSLYHSTIKNTYMHGFQKALEILGDKKFNKEDVRKTFVDAFQKCYEVINSGKFDDITSAIEWLTQTNADNYIQSLQQTEWDVIIKTTCDGMVTGLCMPEVCDCNIIPKLDADGCLILKRI